MAPIEETQKREREEEEKVEEEPAAKVPKVEGEEEDDEDVVEEGSEEESEDECTMDPEVYVAEMFEGVEVDAATLEKFNEAWAAFKEELEKTSEDKHFMILGSPTEIRPVPTEVKEFWEQLPMLQINEKAQALKEEVEEQFLELVMSGGDDAEELDDKDDTAALDKIIKEQGEKQVDYLAAEFKKVAERVAKGELDGALEAAFVLNDFIFEDGGSAILANQLDHAKVEAFLKDSVAGLWTELFKKSDEELKITAKDRKTVINFLNSCGEQLRSGELSDDADDEEIEEVEGKAKEAPAKADNPWANADFFKFAL